MAYEPDEDDEEYFSETDGEDVELTGKEPKFVRIVTDRPNPGPDEPNWRDVLEITPKELSEMTVDKLVPIYITCRNQLATDTRGYKMRRANVKLFMSLISMALREKADLVGTDSFKGSYGTAFRQTKEKFSISDWPAYVAWLNETQNFQTLQKRVSPNAIKEVREADGGKLPPGVDVFSEVEFSVRSPTAKRK